MLTGLYPYDGNVRNNQMLRLSNTVTNQVAGGQAPLSNTTAYPRPVTTADYMAFNGLQCIRYSDNSNNWRVSAPYSMELEVYCENTQDGKWIATNGEGISAGWGEWSIVQTGGSILLQSSITNSGNQFSLPLVAALNAKQWYRLGFMFYTVGSQYRIRGYANDIQVFDEPCGQPYDSPNGMVFAGDWSWDTYPASKDRKWTGRLRNITIARSLFWTV